MVTDVKEVSKKADDAITKFLTDTENDDWCGKFLKGAGNVLYTQGKDMTRSVYTDILNGQSVGTELIKDTATGLAYTATHIEETYTAAKEQIKMTLDEQGGWYLAGEAAAYVGEAILAKKLAGVEAAPANAVDAEYIVANEASYRKLSSISVADNIADAARLKDYYKQAEKYGTGSIKELENGRFRFYEEIKPARTNGEMAGARHVREWDPHSGLKRDWYETIDHNGNIRQVRPNPNITGGVKVHYMFDSEGKYTGKWSPE